jgi:allophanate hydrolase subunit 1
MSSSISRWLQFAGRRCMVMAEGVYPHNTMKIARAGDRALLVDFGRVSAAELHGYAAAARTLPGLVGCTVGQQSLYLLFSGTPPNIDLRPSRVSLAAREHPIEVRFDGADFDEFLGVVRISREEFLLRVATLRLTARYLGFRGGFAYLDGWPAEWSMPRRPTSRPVARGSFAIAGAVAGFYPIDTPGGWNVLGHTDAPLAFEPGDVLTIVPVERPMGRPPVIQSDVPAIAGVTIEGNFATVVRPREAFDEESAILANRLAGNRDDAPVIECAMVVPRVHSPMPRTFAWTGAQSELPHVAPFETREVSGGRIRDGFRGWLAVAKEEGGDVLDPFAPRSMEGRTTIRCAAGPHESPLRNVECVVTPQLNRVGIRLRPLAEWPGVAPADLPSCGMQFGTVQLHPDGSLVAMGPEHPVTGGYLQPLTVLWGERWKLAQLVPGEQVRFVCE